MTLLLIGATGMLAQAARQIAAGTPGDIVVMSRRASQFSFGAPVLDARSRAYTADWRDTDAFLQCLDRIARRHPPVTRAVLWMHGRDEPLRARIVRLIAPGGTLVEVLGSAAARPGAFGAVRLKQMRRLPHIRYRQVLLGFTLDNGQGRWLSHSTICAGVMDALASDDPVTVAGQVEPWDLRP